MIIVVPLLTSDSTSISPRISEIFRFTTSIPTPLPDTSVTFLAVEKPGRNIRSKISFLLKLASFLIRPLLIAFSLIKSVSIPAPSSSI
ncbi:hypothetical protein ES705_24208 [subsurface metagenome]